MPTNRPRPRRAPSHAKPRSTAAAPSALSQPAPSDDPSIPLLVGEMVQELRFPVSLITAYTEQLAGTTDEAARAWLLDGIRRATRQLASALERLEHRGQHRRLFSDGGEHRILDAR